MIDCALVYPTPSLDSPAKGPALSIFYPGVVLEKSGFAKRMRQSCQWEIDSIRSTWVGLRNTSNTSKNMKQETPQKKKRNIITINILQQELSSLSNLLKYTNKIYQK